MRSQCENTFNYVSLSRRTLQIATLLATCCLPALGQTPPAQTPTAPAAAQDIPKPATTAFPASKIREAVIGESTAGSQISWARSTENHLAWVEKTNGQKTVRLDSKQTGGSYEDVKYVKFSGDEQHLAFVAKRKSKWVVVVDGEDRSRDYGRLTSPALSANGKTFAVGACNEKKCHLVVDNAEVGPEYEDISAPGFSSEGSHHVYFGKRNKKWVMVLDDKESGPEMDDYYDWGFSPDGQRNAVAALMKKRWTWVVDGQSAQAHEGRGFGGGWAGVFGPQETMVTGVRSLLPGFHGVSDPLYTSEGKLVYAARLGEGSGVAVFIDGTAGPIFEDVVSSVVVTSDRKHSFYVAKRGESFIEVRDQQAGPSFPGKRDLSFVGIMMMTKDGSHAAYEIVRGGRAFKAGGTNRALRRLVLDSQAGPEYDALGLRDIWFSENGKHSSYLVLGAEGNRDRVIFDGLEGKLYDSVFRGSVKAIDERSIEFVAQNGSQFLRVTETLD